MCGVGLSLFILSIKIIPGSPFFHAIFTIFSKTSFALRLPAAFPVLGFFNSYSLPASAASIKSSVMATEILKLLSLLLSSLQVMKCIISGWSIRSIPIFAPRRVPPCFIASVAESNTVIKDIGPDDMPEVEPTISPDGLSLENEKPVPPPLLWIKAVCFTASNMLSIESSTGSTKHAESCCNSLPAFMRVGEFGINWSEAIIS